MTNPYSDLPSRAFWRSAISEVSALQMPEIYQPRFAIAKSLRIVAAGSCFAQHIGHEFKRRGYGYVDVEPAPEDFPEARLQDFGFNMYSARYGNVYSVRQLVQLFQRAAGDFVPAEHAWLDASGRARDPFRPSIEPDGFCDLSEMERDRAYHLGQVDALLGQSDVFVFTFGLTEAWECIADGAILPACPGTTGGTFDAARYRFKNFSFSEVMADAEAFIARALAINPAMKFLFTVSPVPLTATASGEHVLTASVYSKSVLRAVCGELRAKYPMVDYFPSYELVASHPMRAMHFMPNLRAVAKEGVALVMKQFFAAHEGDAPVEAKPGKAKSGRPDRRARRALDPDDVVCEEALLDAFGQ